MSCVGEPNKSLKSFYHSAGWNVILYLDVFLDPVLVLWISQVMTFF